MDRLTREIAEHWRGRDCTVVCDSRFGGGDRFVALWRAWRDDPQRSARLHVVGAGWQPDARATGDPALANALAAALPPDLRGLHRLSFEGGRVQLLLDRAAGREALRGVIAEVDAFIVDGDDFADAVGFAKSLGRLAAGGARLWADAVPAPRALAALKAAGFRACDGADGERFRADYAPAFTPKRARLGTAAAGERHAIVVGAGLAGCAAAWALAEHGWRTSVVDRHPQPASEASGNQGGIFHGAFHRHDGVHARFNRAAALEAARAVAFAVREHGVAGSADGLLRLETALDVAAMRAALAEQRMAPSYLRALDRADDSAACGLALRHPAWLYASGGWVDPAGLARSFLRRAGSFATFIGGIEIARLAHAGTSDAPRWCALDGDDRVVAEASAVVLAGAGEALRLAGARGSSGLLRRVRGQASAIAADAPGVPLVRLPIGGSGYLLPPHAGRVSFGATSQPDDDPAVRDDDHRRNLERLAGLVDIDVPELDGVSGRTAFRWVAPDRLPLIGAAPLAGAEGDAPRRIAREAGLYVCAGLGSRGISWAALGGQIVAAWISAAPQPVEAALVDAVDPARWVVRAARRRGLRAE